ENTRSIVVVGRLGSIRGHGVGEVERAVDVGTHRAGEGTGCVIGVVFRYIGFAGDIGEINVHGLVGVNHGLVGEESFGVDEGIGRAVRVHHRAGCQDAAAGVVLQRCLGSVYRQGIGVVEGAVRVSADCAGENASRIVDVVFGDVGLAGD